MAGLRRVQQRFNLAVTSILVALLNFARQGRAEAETRATHGHGHPIHARFLRSANPGEVRTRYQGERYRYCMGAGETERRLRLM